MIYQSTETFDSTSFPGVKFTLRKWSVGRRKQYHAALSEPLHRLRLIQDELNDLYALEKAAQERANIAPCTCSHGEHEGPCQTPGCTCKMGVLEPAQLNQAQKLLSDRMELIVDEIQPARIRWAVASIEGIEVDGEPLTVDRLIENGPDELSAEIDAKIEEMLFPREPEVKNSSSPTTSTAPAAGETKSTSAEPAAN